MGKKEGLDSSNKAKVAVHGAYVSDKLDRKCPSVSSTIFLYLEQFF